MATHANYCLKPTHARGSIHVMSNLIPTDIFAAHRLPKLIMCLALLLSCYGAVTAAAWHNIEPLKSRRADVEHELGKPVSGAPAESGALHFKVAGGTVTVTFVSAKFVATKKLAPEYEGTVLEIVLQHDNAQDTPESLGLTKNDDFDHNSKGSVDVYQNLKDGVTYTFINGRLSTTRYMASTEQLLHAQKGTSE
jgi:hypothetical protein